MRRHCRHEHLFGRTALRRPPTVYPLFLATPGITTYNGDIALTNASGFFFQRDERLFLVTSRHVVIDQPSHHLPSRLAITLHLDAQNLSRRTDFSMPLYDAGDRPRRTARRGHRLRVHAGSPARQLLGVHSARMDMGNRDRVQDESLGLKCAWYADILLTLTR